MSLIRQIHADMALIKIFDTHLSLGQQAAEDAGLKMEELLQIKPEINVAFAAAPSQNEFLGALCTNKRIDWKRINAYHLDEYIGLPAGATQGFGDFLMARIFSKLAFKSIHYMNGNALDIEKECDRYATLLKNNPLDLVFMGIGENGHIAFNDPHEARFSDSRLVKTVTLDDNCRMQQVHDGCFKSIDQVPTKAITMTVPAIIASRSIFCMVPAKTKADAMYHTVFDEISESCPATALRSHPDTIIYADADSAGLVIL